MEKDNNRKYSYYAFISYKREDEKWAKWLQRKLESYRLSKKNRTSHPELPRYIRPVFRDKTDISGGVLSEVLKENLLKSKYLILICSPNAASSPWVSKEAKIFIDDGRISDIIPFIIKGSPHSNNPADECFPDTLLELSSEHELLGVNIQQDGKKTAYIRLLSTLLKIPFIELKDRIRDEYIKKKTIFATIISIALLCGFIIWNYYRPLYRYFTDYVDQWGKPEGLFELNKNDVKHRSHTYKFIYNRTPLGQENAWKWRVSSVECIGPLGKSLNEPSDILFRFPIIKLEYYEGSNNVKTTAYCDKDSKELLRVRYNGDATIADIENVVEQSDKGYFFEYITPDNDQIFTPSSKYHHHSSITRFHFKRNNNGVIEYITLHRNNSDDLNSSLTTDADGVASIKLLNDSLGRCFAQYSYDRFGGLVNMKEFFYGRSSLFYIIMNSYQKDNCIVKRINEKPTIDGYNRSVSYYNSSMKRIIGKDECWKDSIEYNYRQKKQINYYYGTDDKLRMTANKYPFVSTVYNKRGDWIRHDYYLQDSTLHHSKYALYDYGKTNTVTVYQISADTLMDIYGKGVKYAQRQSGNKFIKYNLYTVDENKKKVLINGQDGYAIVVSELNDRGATLVESYYNASRESTQYAGKHKIVFTYDSRGNRKTVSYYNNNDMRIKDSNGVSKRAWTVDEFGQRNSVRYYDEKDNPCVNIQYGAHEITIERDSLNRICGAIAREPSADTDLSTNNGVVFRIVRDYKSNNNYSDEVYIYGLSTGEPFRYYSRNKLNDIITDEFEPEIK